MDLLAQVAEPKAGYAPYADDPEDRTVVAPVGGLASAFSHVVAAPESAPLSSLSAPADEWYVGINGVPVGPIRLAELRTKASSAAIGPDSLVWRDGFEEWLPLRTFPELVAIVEEGLSSARASQAPLGDPWALSPTPAPVASPFSPRGAASPDALLAGASPFGGPFEGFGQPPPSTGSAVVSERPFVEIDESVIPKKRTGTPLIAWVAVVVALVFGLGIGFVVFDRTPAEPIVKYVEVPSKTDPAAAPSATDPSTPEEVAADPDAGAKVAVKSGGGKVGSATPSTKEPEKSGGLTGLAGLSGLQGGGPTSGPGTKQTSAQNSGGLDSTQVQQTVGKYTGSVRRSCWQPQLDARSKDAPSSARVTVTINVAPSGSVTGVSTSGDPKGYPGLANCISSRVRGWQFPASGGPTTVNVPFVFAAQ